MSIIASHLQKITKIQTQELRLSDLLIMSAHQIDSVKLAKFYRRMYPHHRNSLPHIWKWLNRSSFYQNQIPLVVLYRGLVIAHAGMIPFHFFVDGKQQTGSWFIDFSVLPEFQKLGIGSLLTRKWMEFSDLYVTFCNEKSMDLFKKFGWIESFDTYLHIYPLIPFNQFQRDNGLIKLYEQQNTRIRSFKVEFVKQGCLCAFAVRDVDYLSWRLLDSPHANKYRICSLKGLNMIIKLSQSNRGHYIDILCVSDPSQHSLICAMIVKLAVWGREQAYFYIRYLTMNLELSTYLKEQLKPNVSHPRFAFYAQKEALLNKLKTIQWPWELIDSDWEHFDEI